MLKQFVSDWDPNMIWHEWKFTGWQDWDGEQLNGDEFFWIPKGKHSSAFDIRKISDRYNITKSATKLTEYSHTKVAISSFIRVANKTDPNDTFEIEMKLVSQVGSPNKIQLMVRCPRHINNIVRDCIDQGYEFTGQWPTEHVQNTLRKPARFTESYQHED